MLDFLEGFGGSLVRQLSVLLCSVLLFSAAQAQKEKPVSISYKDLVDCFPELTDESISFKVDLNKLHGIIDEKFVTSRSQLVMRQVGYVDADNQKKRLTLRARNPGAWKVSYQLSVEKVDDKGIYTEVKLSEAQRINPKQEVLNNLLLGANIKSDRYSYNDTKLNGVVLTYTRDFKTVEELELADKPRNRSASCENQKDLGVICTCSKK